MRELAPSAVKSGASHDRHPLPLLCRLAVGLGAPVLLAAGFLWFLRGGRLFCIFYEWTGLFCPGCGSGRALRALLRGDLAAAFGHNALALLLAPPCVGILVWEYLRAVFPGLRLRNARLPGWVGPLALVLILSFWILRNLPAFAFLAP